MFNWLVTIFMLASLVILFAAWTRAIRAKDLITTVAAKREWEALRILVFVALVVEVVLLIFALIGLRIPFAYFGGAFIVFFSVVYFYTVSFFLKDLEEHECTPKAASTTQEAPTPEPAPAAEGTVTIPTEKVRQLTHDMRNGLSVILGMAESLRDQGSESPDDLKEVAETMATSAKQVVSLVDELAKTY